MSVKGRKFHQPAPEPTDRRDTWKGGFKPRRAVDRERSPLGKFWGVRRTRQPLSEVLEQAQMDTTAVDEEGCARCGLEPQAWQGSNGKGYTKGGTWYCCQLCADELECPCQQ
jgi:hypothetical protein